MNYGLSRAVPMSILGFLIGMLLTIFLRTVQGLVPNWDAQLSIVLGGIVSTVFFVWGMGAFDPTMSAHGGEEHGDEHGDEPHVEAHAALPATVGETHAHEPHKSIIDRLLDIIHPERLEGSIKRLLDFRARPVEEGSLTGWFKAQIAKFRAFYQAGDDDLERAIKFAVALIPLVPLAILLFLTNVVNMLRRLPVIGWIITILLLLPMALLLLGMNVLIYTRKGGGDVFLATTIVLVILLGLAVVAVIPNGPAIVITSDPVGAPAGNGYVTINLFGSDYVFSKLSLFAIFFVWTILSLALAGGGIALLMSFLSREVRAVKGKAPAPEALIPPAPLRLLSRGATWLLNRLPEPPKPQR
jgi:hypothetical protein